MSVILDVQNIKKYFPLDKDYVIKAVNGVSLCIRPGENVGLVGESGCGKSTLARTIMGIHQPDAGSIYFAGWEISDANTYHRHKKEIQQGMQLIFQDPDGALNPHMTAEDIVRESISLAGGTCSEDRISEIFSQVGLEKRYRKSYPRELSGGQRQRIAIARCIAVKPSLIIADEPIAALDVSIQAQIINLLQDLQAENGFSMLFIAHDLSMVRHLCDRIYVMYQGRIVECGRSEELFSHPCHGYTKQLLSSILLPDPEWERNKKVEIFNDPLCTKQLEKVFVSHDHWFMK